jgi:hypothetical protein
MHRAGWLGAWDALVSAMTRKPRFTFAQPVVISWWARHGANVVMNGLAVEIGKDLGIHTKFFGEHSNGKAT